MSNDGRYEVLILGVKVVKRFIAGEISDMECLATCRKLKSVYDLLNCIRGAP